METDIGNPIDYDPSIDPLNNEKNEEDIQDDQPYYNDYSMQVHRHSIHSKQRN